MGWRQLEHFVTAFTVLDNVFRASLDVLKATGLLATIIWVKSLIDMYIYVCSPVYRRMHRHAYTRIDICTDICIDMCIDVCIDMCVDMCACVHVCNHTCRHV